MPNIPVGSDCFAPYRRGWRTGCRGKLIQYVDHPVDGHFALLETTDKRTIQCPVDVLELWGNGISITKEEL